MSAPRLVLVALLATCIEAAAAQPAPVAEKAPAEPTLPSAPETRPHLILQPGTAKPGDPVLVTVRGLTGLPTGTLGGRALRFVPWQGGAMAISGLSVDLAPGRVDVKVTVPASRGAAPVELTGTLEVIPPGYPERELRVASKYVDPSKELKARMEADRRAFAIAFAQPLQAPFFGQNFAWPRPATITAPFGDRRSFNGKLQSQHFGTDLDGATGEPILAANDGVVVMTRENQAAGNTVIVHHGGGLFTTYFHMSRILVKNGAKVRQGDRLGLVGKTGRVTGPHLHWGVKVDDLWVDGQSLLKLDFFPAPLAAPSPASPSLAAPSLAHGSPELGNP
ncbi:M23 family peptidase [Corallococcus sp. H22C18031201]|nr:M23 family peptidase [Corallococcus sp. H22C18031201]